MASARFAWGIDVGNRALKAVRLIRDGGRIKVDDFEIIEHGQVLSNAGDNRPSLIQSAIANFVQRHNLKNNAIAVAVSGQSSFARFIKLPPVEPKKIPEIVRFEAIQQIPFPLDDVEWSYQLFQPTDSPDVEVGIFAMRKELVNHHLKFFTDVDLNVQLVQMSPLAVYNAMYHDQQINGTTMIVDLGAENTDLIIADNDTIWMRSIPIGGNNFTEALVKSFKLSFAKAEDLKRNAATSKYARQIFQAMRPIFSDLVAEVQRSIGFYASVHRDSRIKKMLAIGGTFRLPGLLKYLEQNLQLPIERINSLGAGAPADNKLASTFNENLLSMVTAYGLALQAMEAGKINSSLLPEQIRQAKLWKEKTKWFAAAAGLIVAGTGIGYGSLYLQRDAFDSAVNFNGPKIAAVRRQAEGLSRDWSEIEQSGSVDRQRILNIKSMEDYRTLWPQLLSDLRSALPDPGEALKTAMVKGDVQAIRAIDRGSRNLILIDSVYSRYLPNMASILASEDAFKQAAKEISSTSAPMQTGMGMPSMPMPTPTPNENASGAAAGPRGFLVTVYGTTPNRSGYTLIDDSLIKSMLSRSTAAGSAKRPYRIIKASILTAQQIKADPTRMAALKAAYDNLTNTNNIITGVPTVTTGAPAVTPAGTPAPAVADPYADRLTGENTLEDWQFIVVFAVELDPPASPATP